MSNAGESWGAQSPQGPGWYQASDGLWYPPADQPAGAPVTPESSASRATVVGGAPVAPAAGPPPAQAAAPPSYSPPPAAAPSYAPSGWQPGMVQLSYNAPTEQVPKFKWIYAWLTCIGLVIQVFIAQILAMFSTYAAYFGILLKQRVHPKSHDNIVKSYRAQWRLMTYLLQWRNDVPTMPTTGAIDDGGDPKASLSIAYGGEGLARFGPIIKFFTTLGDLIGVLIAGILAYIAWIIGIIGIVTKGQFPEEQKAKIVDAYAKAMRYQAHLLLTDVKPVAV